MIDIKSFNSLIELTDAFPTEEVCLKYLESLIWEDGVVSPFDPESKVYVCSNNRYICKNTGKSFNVKTGTIFENTKLPLRKWFMAIWLVLTHKKRYIIFTVVKRYKSYPKDCMVHVAAY